MTTAQSCPICGLENVSADQCRCPQCDADLACFKVLDAIPEETAPATAEVRPITKKIAIVAAALLILLILGFLVFQFYRFRALEAQNAELLAESIKLREQSTKLEEQTLRLAAQYEKLSPQSTATEFRDEKTAAQDEKPPETAVARLEEQRVTSEIGEPEKQAGTDKSSPEQLQDESATASLKIEDAESQSDTDNPSSEQLQDESATTVPKIEDAETQADRLQEEPAVAESASSKTQDPEKQSGKRSGFWSYEATEKDTLWDVAEKFYGAGYYYPVLLEHNPHIGIYSIGKGSRLKILNNIEQVKNIYRRITVKEGYKTYWNYTIVEGDTLQSVAERFYKTEEVKKQLSGSDSEAELQPGKKIKILLK